jgi:hypothetical protein
VGVVAGPEPSLDAPLCAFPRHAAAIQRVIDASADLVTAQVSGPGLVALVLTGSFARGEGTVLEVDGHLRVLGDLEFFLVSASAHDDRVLRGRLGDLGREATARFGTGDVRVDIEFGSLELDCLRRARPSIFLHDLVRHGRVVRGRADVLAEVPPFAPADIPREDALFLLFNRLIEQLDAYERAGDLHGEALLDLAQQRQKLVLDLAGSALAFQGLHTSSYALRPSAFARLAAATPALARRLPGHFQRDLALAARSKIDPGVMKADDRLPVALGLREQRAWIRERIVADVPAVSALLAWELERLLGASAPLPVLLDRFLSTPSWSRRAWDWAKIALAPTPAPLPVSLTRAARLAWRSTPRALLYAAGALAYNDLPRGPVAPRAIARRLFLARRAMPRDARGQRRAIVALWRWCVRNS